MNRATPELRLRPAQPADEDQLLSWRNLDWVVALGATGARVTPEEHATWFRTSLANDDRLLFIALVDDIPQGMIRYDRRGPDEAEVSIYLMPCCTGKGLGARAFHQSLPHAMARLGIQRATARVLHDNDRSLTFFKRLGFQETERTSELTRLTCTLPTVPHSRTSVTEQEVAAAAHVVRTGHLAQGPQVAALEQAWQACTGTNAAAAVGSGLGALRLSLHALGVGTDDEVLVPAYSCVALFNAVLAVGATPIPVDVSPGTWNMDPEAASDAVTGHTKALIATHMFGAPADIGRLHELNLPIVEDCAHGIGSAPTEQALGAMGTISITSFYATKMLGCGEGGMVASHDPGLIERVKKARDYGDQAPHAQHLNDKMSDVHAAIARVQLDRLDDVLAERREIARRYLDLLAADTPSADIQPPPTSSGRLWYRFTIETPRADAATACRAAKRLGVALEQPVWDYRHTEAWPGDLPNTARAFDHVVSLPTYPGLTAAETERVVQTLRLVIEEASA